MTKKPVFSVAFIVFEDGTYKEQIVLEPNGNSIAANVIFNLMTGQVAEGVLNFLQKKYPKQFKEINAMVDNMSEQFMEEATEVMEERDDAAPLIRASEVFGGKNE